MALLAVLGSSLPSKAVINELTTVASAFTNARFLNGDALSGNPLGLRIAARNVPNLVDPATGARGKVPLDLPLSRLLVAQRALGLLLQFEPGLDHGGSYSFLAAARRSRISPAFA